jgi:AraC family transcriptional regulator
MTASKSITEEIHRLFSSSQVSLRHTAAQEAQFASHSHAAYTVTVLLAGRMQTTIGEKQFDLATGQIALTNANENHAAQAIDFEFLSVSINPTLINELITEMGLTRAFADITFRASVVTDETIVIIAQAIITEMAQEKVGQREMLESLARQLAIHLLRSHFAVRKSAQIELSRAGLVDRRLRRALEFMHDNYARELALEEIAAAAYLSEFHFARLFKQITGVTPHVYLANIRIEKSRKLLMETQIPIIEIVAMVGYQSQSHFTKIFKSVTGLTPRTYRESK